MRRAREKGQGHIMSENTALLVGESDSEEEVYIRGGELDVKCIEIPVLPNCKGETVKTPMHRVLNRLSFNRHGIAMGQPSWLKGTPQVTFVLLDESPSGPFGPLQGCGI